jgi:hypothetical protein
MWGKVFKHYILSSKKNVEVHLEDGKVFKHNILSPKVP